MKCKLYLCERCGEQVEVPEAKKNVARRLVAEGKPIFCSVECKDAYVEKRKVKPCKSSS